jgi:hypothetical protein
MSDGVVLDAREAFRRDGTRRPARDRRRPRRPDAAPGPTGPGPDDGAGVAPLDPSAPLVSGPRRLDEPRPVRVRADRRGRPLVVDGRRVEAVRESWLVEDRWWTERPLRRRYWEVVTADGRDLVVFRELVVGGWFAQRG